MAKFEIKGGAKLNGKIKVAGNKNSVLPIMAACLLTEDTCTIENVPNISDVVVMAKILELCGAKVERISETTITVNAKEIKSAEIPEELTEKLRASVLLLGPMASRVGKLKMGYPGGDVIGRRPLDTHFQVLEALGAKVTRENDSFIVSANSLKGAEIFLKEASVTATENAIIAASKAEGVTRIKRAASEPHIVDLCEFINKMGGSIQGIGTNLLTITGVPKLFGATHSVRPDHVEVGTFAILAALISKKVEISPIIKEDLDMILLTLSEFGVKYEIEDEKLTVFGSNLNSVQKVVTGVWPGFPTDLMAPMIVLATQAKGVTILHDWMYESRMFFVDKLLSMGARVEIADPHRVFVYGQTKLYSQKLDTPDIRAGIALVIAALCAQGESMIEKTELIERGYENIVERLTSIGAKIQRLN